MWEGTWEMEDLRDMGHSASPSVSPSLVTGGWTHKGQPRHQCLGQGVGRETRDRAPKGQSANKETRIHTPWSYTMRSWLCSFVHFVSRTGKKNQVQLPLV